MYVLKQNFNSHANFSGRSRYPTPHFYSYMRYLQYTYNISSPNIYFQHISWLIGKFVANAYHGVSIIGNKSLQLFYSRLISIQSCTLFQKRFALMYMFMYGDVYITIFYTYSKYMQCTQVLLLREDIIISENRFACAVIQVAIDMWVQCSAFLNAQCCHQ